MHTGDFIMNIENYKLIKTNKKEMNDVINFLNYCFDIKFQNAVEKLYKNEIDYSNNHYIIKKIILLLLLFVK